MILKQKTEKKLEKGFSSGMIPERIIVLISFQESNSSSWDELNFENSRRIAGVLKNATCKGKRSISKSI